jgi:hypothetical protein
MNTEETRSFVDFKIANKGIDIPKLETWIENAECWRVELGCVNYLLGQVLERKVNNGEDCFAIIELVYKLEDQLYFQIHECDQKFVDYMLWNVRQLGESLEDELVALHNKMSEHNYE